MDTTSRKQRELAQRDNMLVDRAQELLEQQGFANLTLEKLAAHTSFSKGTIYNHFANKEDLLTALCVSGLQIQYGMFRNVLAFPGNSREKIVGMHYAYNLYARRHPSLFMCLLSGLTPSVLEKTSERRLNERFVAEGKITEVLDFVINEAIEAGEIRSPLAQDVAAISFANWAMSLGTTALIQAANQATALHRLELSASLRRNVALVLDGLQWLPLSHEWDYEASWRRLQEYFDDTEDISPYSLEPVMA